VAQGDEDNLKELYRAAYAESPRTNGSSTITQPSPSAKSLQRIEVLQQVDAPLLFSPKMASFEGTRKRSASPVVAAAVAAAAVSGSDRAPVSPPRDMSPPIPSFNTPLRKRNVPVSEISADAHEGALERTESGRFLPNLSPMTMASMGTEGDVSKGKLKSAVARWKSLSEALPNLDDGGYLEAARDEENAGMEEARSTRSSGDVSSSTSEELDAIIAEAKQQYGMDFPDELIKALRKASVSTLATDGSMGSFNDSNLSSLLMLKLDLLSEHETSDEMIQRELILNVARKESIMSDASRFTTTYAARLSPAKFFNDLVIAAEIELGHSISPEITQELEAFFLHNSDSSSLSRVELKLRLDSALDNIGESDSTPLHHAFIAGFEEITTSFVEVDSKRSPSTFDNASGYFSAVSEGGDVSVLFNEFDDEEDNAEDIFEELKNVNGSIPTELVKIMKPDPADNNGSMEFDSLDLEYSESTLAYSASTLAYSAYSSASNILPTDVTPATLKPFDESELKKTREDDLAPAFDRFMSEASKQYGMGFPGEVRATLRSLWESGANLNGKFDAEELITQSKDEFGVDLSDEIVGALERTSRKARFSLAQARELSIISALSDSGSMADSCNSSAEFNFGIQDVVADDTTEDDADIMSNEAPPPPPMPGTPSGSIGIPKTVANKNVGPNLLREARKVYPKKLPFELSYVLSRSTALQYAMNTDEEIDIILKECEEMTGKRLPADLVLSLREASVTLRTPSNSLRSRRSARQSTGSFRSTSRSSGMPSIQEWTMTSSEADSPEKQVEVTREATPRNAKSIPVEITTKEKSSNEAARISTSLHVRGPLQDLASPEIRIESMESERSSAEDSIHFEALRDPDERPIMTSYNASGSMGSLPALSSHSQLGNSRQGHESALFNSSMATQMHSNQAPPESAPDSAMFNNSMATQMHSNGSKAPAWTPDSIEVMRAASMDSSLNTSETSEFWPRRNSTGSSTSTEVTMNTIQSGTTSISYDASAASTLNSRKLPIGVIPTSPLPGIESDDLSFIFKEAAKRL
jgi:hypothetical protein